eukprot:g14119.t1
MVEPKARLSLCRRTGALTLLAVLAVCCCFFATAVNVTVSNANEDMNFGESRMDIIGNEERGRCFVVEGEERTRCHPNIFFFGVSKCGTTSMVKWMAKHPSFRWVSRVKSSGKLIKPGQEARAFQFQTNEEFTSKYPFTAPAATEADPVVDYTPHYSILAYVPYLIKGLYGESAYDGTVKYIVFLREPAARTVSSWRFKYDLKGIEDGSREGFRSERRSLEEAFQDGSKRVKALVECRSRYLPSQLNDEVDLKTCKPDDFLEENPYFSHVGKSMYFMQIERWIRLLGRDNVKVLFLEEVAVDPLGELASVFDFLGMDLVDEAEGKKGRASLQEWEEIVKHIRNTANPRKIEILGPQATPELMQSMRDFFAPHNAQLAELLGRPLPDEWSSVS